MVESKAANLAFSLLENGMGKNTKHAPNRILTYTGATPKLIPTDMEYMENGDTAVLVALKKLL